MAFISTFANYEHGQDDHPSFLLAQIRFTFRSIGQGGDQELPNYLSGIVGIIQIFQITHLIIHQIGQKKSRENKWIEILKFHAKESLICRVGTYYILKNMDFRA